ncbi:GOLPH3/VPS74 family protein [Dactylosporangium darangshiense]
MRVNPAVGSDARSLGPAYNANLPDGTLSHRPARQASTLSPLGPPAEYAQVQPPLPPSGHRAGPGAEHWFSPPQESTSAPARHSDVAPRGPTAEHGYLGRQAAYGTAPTPSGDRAQLSAGDTAGSYDTDGPVWAGSGGSARRDGPLYEPAGINWGGTDPALSSRWQPSKPAGRHHHVAREREAPLVADDFFCISHHAYRGHRLVAAEVLGLGLASMLLGELWWDNRIDLWQGMVIPKPRAESRMPISALTFQIEESIRGEQSTRTIEDMLRYLAIDAEVRVGERMLARNQVVRVRARVGLSLFKQELFVPVTPNEWEWVGLSVATALNQRRPLDPLDLHLAGLAIVTNLFGQLMGEYDGAERLPPLLRGLPEPVRHLMAVTRRVVQDRAETGV